MNLNGANKEVQRPNVLWVLADQMRGQAMSCMGDPNVGTPNLDRLAYEGFHFTHAVSGTPWCTPFRGALLTGRYPHRSGVPGNHCSLPEGAKTVAHTFREHGYRTCYIGKWHLDGDRPGADKLKQPEYGERVRAIAPEHRGGFEDWWAYENNNRPFDCIVHTGYYGTVKSAKLPGYETDGLTDLLIGWLRDRAGERGPKKGEAASLHCDMPTHCSSDSGSNASPLQSLSSRSAERKPHSCSPDAQDQPFFAVLSVQPPHTPYVAPQEDMRRHNPARIDFRLNVPPVARVREEAGRDLAGYYAAIERLDYNIGRIREALEETGFAQNTYIVFFSDHGDMHGSHGLFRKSCPWEEAIRIPLIIGGPSRNHQTRKMFDFPVNHVDIGPTTLGLCGIGKPDYMDGFDYSPWIKSKQTPEETPDSAYLSMYMPSGTSYGLDRPYRGIITRDGWKYCVLEGQPWLLYYLQDDPYEFVNLAHTRAFHAVRARLHDKLLLWAKRLEDDFVMPAL